MADITIEKWLHDTLKVLAEHGLIQKREFTREGRMFCEYRFEVALDAIRPEEPMETSLFPAEKSKAIATPLEEREKRFSDECREFTREFGKQLVDDFILYWTEPNKSHTKMRFEQQSTWDTHRRMLTWKRNNFNKYDNVAIDTPREISAAEIQELMNWRRND